MTCLTLTYGVPLHMPFPRYPHRYNFLVHRIALRRVVVVMIVTLP